MPEGTTADSNVTLIDGHLRKAGRNNGWKKVTLVDGHLKNSGSSYGAERSFLGSTNTRIRPEVTTTKS